MTNRAPALVLLSCRPMVGWELDQPTDLSLRLVHSFPASQARYSLAHISCTTSTSHLSLESG